MKRLCCVLALLPLPAFAGEMANALGFAGQWSASTVGYARALFPAVVMVSLVLELLFRDPASPPSFRHTLWRGAIVLALLLPVGGQTLYGRGCAVLAGVSDGLTATLAPVDPWGEFAKVAEKWHQEMAKARVAEQASLGDQADSLAAELGGFVFETLLSIGLLLGQGSLWVMKQLAFVLSILLYALGPLALVFWVPMKSDSLGRWLRTYITVLTWPVMSAVILGIITRASLMGLNGASPAFASIATAMLLGVVALAVPVVSSSLVGGSMGAIGAGVSTLMQSAGLGTAMASAAMGAGARGAAAGASAAAGPAKALGGALAGALQPDLPLSLGPPLKGGPRAAGALVPNAIDAAPLHETPAVERQGLGLKSPPPPPIDAFSGRMEAPKPAGAFQGRLDQPVPPPVPSRAATPVQAVATPAASSSPIGAAPHGPPGRAAPAPARPPPPVPTEPARAPMPAAPHGADVPTAPAQRRPASWNATIERLGQQALQLEHAPESATRPEALRNVNAKLDRAVKALDEGKSVEEWMSSESRK
jgi:hypothetical protein